MVLLIIILAILLAFFFTFIGMLIYDIIYFKKYGFNDTEDNETTHQQD